MVASAPGPCHRSDWDATQPEHTHTSSTHTYESSSRNRDFSNRSYLFYAKLNKIRTEKKRNPQNISKYLTLNREEEAKSFLVIIEQLPNRSLFMKKFCFLIFLRKYRYRYLFASGKRQQTLGRLFILKNKNISLQLRPWNSLAYITNNKSWLPL